MTMVMKRTWFRLNLEMNLKKHKLLFVLFLWKELMLFHKAITDPFPVIERNPKAVEELIKLLTSWVREYSFISPFSVSDIVTITYFTKQGYRFYFELNTNGSAERKVGISVIRSIFFKIVSKTRVWNSSILSNFGYTNIRNYIGIYRYPRFVNPTITRCQWDIPIGVAPSDRIIVDRLWKNKWCP